MIEQLGVKFSLKTFTEAALDEGALPLPLLEPLLMERLRKNTEAH